MSNNNQDKKKTGAQIIRERFFEIKNKQRPPTELNEAVKPRKPANGSKKPPLEQAPERKIARPKHDADLDF